MPVSARFQTSSLRLCRLVQFLAIGTVLTICTACSVGPDYLAPETEMPATWLSEVSEQAAGDEPQVSLDRWWELFGDPALNELVAHAIGGDGRSFDLRIAAARVRQARAELQIAQARWFPSIDFSAGVQRSRISPNSLLGASAGQSGGGFSFLPGLTNNLFSLGFDALWEFDFFGRTRRAVEAQEALAEATEENLNQVSLTLAAEIARNYIEYRANDERIAAVERNIKAQQDSVTLSRSRFNAGMTSELDVLQADAQAATTESQRPTLVFARDQARNRLAVLLGEYPAFVETFFRQHPGRLPGEVRFSPRSLPAEILRKRPDIRAAERQLAASTARIGVATAAFFPDFSLSLAGSLQSRDSNNWLEWASRSWSVAPRASLPIFQGGRLVGNLDAANAEQEAAFENYQRTVYSAVEEVENSISSYRQQQLRVASLSRAFEANRQSMEIARKLYTEGLADFLRVLDSQRALSLTEDAVIATRAARITSLIALFKSLGGGWDSRPKFMAEVAESKK